VRFFLFVPFLLLFIIILIHGRIFMGRPNRLGRFEYLFLIDLAFTTPSPPPDRAADPPIYRTTDQATHPSIPFHRTDPSNRSTAGQVADWRYQLARLYSYILRSRLCLDFYTWQQQQRSPVVAPSPRVANVNPRGECGEYTRKKGKFRILCDSRLRD